MNEYLVHKTIVVQYAGDTEANLEPISASIMTIKREKLGAFSAPTVISLSSDDIQKRSYWKGVLRTLRGLTPGYLQIK